MIKIKLNKDTEITTNVIEYLLNLHKKEAKRINNLKDYYNNNLDKTKINAYDINADHILNLYAGITSPISGVSSLSRLRELSIPTRIKPS